MAKSSDRNVCVTLIENGEVYAPEKLGRTSVLALGSQIAKVGCIDRAALERSSIPCEVIDASGLLVTPGFIDGHLHLLGGSGEDGFSTQSPEISFSEVVATGTTTVVGCLGLDTHLKTLSGLLAKAKSFTEQGIKALIYTGGYDVPPQTLLGSVREDVLYIGEIIGAGEVAIADDRSSRPTAPELARIAAEAATAGRLARKPGLLHLHVGEARERLSIVRELVRKHGIPPATLYPTHVQRTERLLAEAIALSRRGSPLDIDTSGEDLVPSLETYVALGGELSTLTLSSDAGLASPWTLREQLAAAARRFSLAELLPLVTTNPARVLALEDKGRLAPGLDADVLVLEPGTLAVRDVFARGQRLVADGRLVARDAFLSSSNRVIELRGERAA